MIHSSTVIPAFGINTPCATGPVGAAGATAGAGAASAAGAAASAGAASPDAPLSADTSSPGVPIAHTFTNTGTSSPSL